MKCPHCGKSLWFVKKFCPFCRTGIQVSEGSSDVTSTNPTPNPTHENRSKELNRTGRIFLALFLVVAFANATGVLTGDVMDVLQAAFFVCAIVFWVWAARVKGKQ
jgi:hypothetical protein